MDIQNYLEQFDISRRKARILHNEYEEEVIMIKSIISSSYYDQKFKDDKRLIIAKAKAQKLKDLEQKELKICNDIKAAIERIPDVKGEILYKRYINCDTWDRIAEALFFSVQHVHRLHKQALEELQNVLDQDVTTE